MIYLFRHGETDYNLNNRFLGQTDLMLCRQGVDRFEYIAKHMRAEKINAVYSSGYKRAIQSAEIISNSLQVPHHIHPNLGERDLGILDGRSKKDKQYSSLIPKLMSLSFTPPKAGKAIDALRRFSAELDKIAKCTLGDVLVVSHAGVIALYLKHVVRETKKGIFLDNGSFHLLDTDEEGVIYAKKLNQTV